MRFKISQMCIAALVAPVKLKKEVVGLLVVTRQDDRPFNSSNRTLLESVADYASISLVNARLFRALQERARSLQQVAEQSQANERNKDEIIKHIQHDLGKPLAEAIQAIDSLLIGENTRLNAIQKGVLRTTQDKLKEVTLLMNKIQNKRSVP